MLVFSILSTGKVCALYLTNSYAKEYQK